MNESTSSILRRIIVEGALNLDKLAKEFLSTEKYFNPALPSDTKGRCDGIATRMQKWLELRGIKSKIVQATGFIPPLGADAHPDWLGFSGKDQKFLGHVVVRIGDKVIDLTSSQFGKKYEKPYVMSMAEFRKRWKKIKTSDRLWSR